MTVDFVVGLINLVLSLLTLGIVLHFWWRHRTARFARGWWVMAIAFGIFAVSETFGMVVILNGQSSTIVFSLTIRVLFMATLIGGLYQLFEAVLEAQQQALLDAQNTIHLQTEAVTRAREIEILARLSEHLTVSLDLETVLQELCRAARELTGADSVSARLPAATAGEFRFAVDFASALKSRPERLNPKIDELCWKVVQTGRPAVIEDARTHPLFGPASPDWLGSLAAFPLRRGTEVIGVLALVFGKPQALTSEMQRLLTALADQAAVAVRNAQQHEALEQSARTDALTGLANRRSFNETLTAEIRRARRYNSSLALIMADVDKLKAVNDRYGHVAGDTLLSAAAQALRNVVRATDLPARLGGDEFVVVLPGTSVAEAHVIADRIRQETARLSFDWNGELIPVRLSLGVSGGTGADLPEASALLTAADEDLYRARGGPPPASPD